MDEKGLTPLFDEMFVSAIRSSGDLAGVFEHDGETGFFYLYDQAGRSGYQRVIGAIHILSNRPDFSEDDVEVRWNPDEEGVGFFVRGRLWAAFSHGQKHGGDYQREGSANIPESVASSFRA